MSFIMSAWLFVCPCGTTQLCKFYAKVSSFTCTLKITLSRTADRVSYRKQGMKTTQKTAQIKSWTMAGNEAREFESNNRNAQAKKLETVPTRNS